MAISRYEQNFMTWVFEIMQNGFYQKNERTGIATKRKEVEGKRESEKTGFIKTGTISLE